MAPAGVVKKGDGADGVLTILKARSPFEGGGSSARGSHRVLRLIEESLGEGDGMCLPEQLAQLSGKTHKYVWFYKVLVQHKNSLVFKGAEGHQLGAKKA